MGIGVHNSIPIKNEILFMFKLKYLYRFVTYCLLQGALIACDDTDGLMRYTNTLLNTSSLEIPRNQLIQNGVALVITAPDKNIQPGDKLFFRKQDLHAEIPVTWGVKYIGRDNNGNRIYDWSTLNLKIEIDDQWVTGDWDLVLQRGNERQILQAINFQILDLKKDDQGEAAYINMDDLFVGKFIVYANGWKGPETDSIEFLNFETGFAKRIPAPTASGEDQAYLPVTLSFIPTDLETGPYVMNVCRWQYDLKQELCRFDHFRYELVDSDLILKDETGQYYIDFYLDKVLVGDKVKVTYGTGKNAFFNVLLEEQYFDSVKKIYRIYIPENQAKDGREFKLTIIRNNKQVSLTGSKSLIIE
ncbi:MAG: hypothetical protein RR212_11745 [Bacteroidales bacterium]